MGIPKKKFNMFFQKKNTFFYGKSGKGSRDRLAALNQRETRPSRIWTERIECLGPYLTPIR